MPENIRASMVSKWVNAQSEPKIDVSSSIKFLLLSIKPSIDNQLMILFVAYPATIPTKMGIKILIKS
jgi:hypothetical protein